MSHQAARTSPCTPTGTRPANATSSFELVPQPIASRRSLSRGDVPMIALLRSPAALVVALIIGCGVPGPALAAKPHHPAPAPQTLAQTVAACRWRVPPPFRPAFLAHLDPAARV